MIHETHARRLARLTAWGLLAMAAATVLRAGLMSHAVAQLMDAGFDTEPTAIMDRLRVYQWALPPIVFAASLATATLVGLLALSARGTAAWAGGLAAGLMLLSTSIDVFGWFAQTTDYRVGVFTMKLLYTVDIIAGQAWLALVLVAATHVARANGRHLPGSLPLAAAPFLVWPLLYWLRQVHGGVPAAPESPWVGFFVGAGIWACGVGWVAYVLFRAGRPGAGPAYPPEPDRSALGGEWRVAVDGLRLYANALSWRLALTLIGYMLLLFAVLGTSQSLAKLVAWLLPLSLAITSVAMAIGIFQFSRQPGYSPARSAAASAFAAMIVGTLLQLWSLLLVFQVLGSSGGAHRRLREVAAQAQSFDTWAMGVGFLALVLLLVSYGQLANFVGSAKLFGRVVGVASAIVLLGFAALGLRGWIGSSSANVTTLLSMAILVLGFALFAVIAYIQLTRAIEQALRERLVDVDAPPMAVVVNETR